MLKKTAALLSAVTMLFLSSCGAATDSANREDIILDAAELEYDTVFAEFDSIGKDQHAQAEYLNPYSQSLYISESGVIGKIYTGSEINKGDLICEVLVDGLSDEIEKQKLITDTAQKSYNSMRRSGGSGTDLEFAQLNYENEKLKYDKLLARAENAKIYAPCSGTINFERDGIFAGADVYSGQKLCDITDSGDNYLCAFVYGAPLEDINFGSKVQVKQGANTETEGKVIDIIQQDKGANYAGCYYVLDIPDDIELQGSSSIDVIFSMNKKDNVLVIPQQALKHSGDRYFVNVLVGGIKVETDVEIGISSDNFVEIISGLYGGEELILS